MQTMPTGLARQEASYAKGKVGNIIEAIYGQLPGAFLEHLTEETRGDSCGEGCSKSQQRA